jgi:hypothetical protein
MEGHGAWFLDVKKEKSGPQTIFGRWRFGKA